MFVTMQTYIYARLKSLEKSIRVIAEAGYDGFDISTDFYRKDPKICIMDRKDYKDYALHLKKVADDAGTRCIVAHLPNASFGRYENDPGFIQAVRAIEAVSIMGAKAAVIHAGNSIPGGKDYLSHREEVIEYTQKWLRRIVPYAKEFGVKLAIENSMHKRSNDDPWSFGINSITEDYLALIDGVDSEWMTACLDIGHAALAKADIPALIRGLGKERLSVIHVHDNGIITDDHMIPYMGKIDFESIISALRDIGFDGVLDFEANTTFLKYPAELVPNVSRFGCEVGRYLQRRISN